MKIEEIAVVCHQANLALCVEQGDFSQLDWNEAPEWQTKSAIIGVKFHLENPEAGDSASHDSWVAEKIADGWAYGEVKDLEAKTHPCIVPFDKLPPEQQAKDTLFRSIVHALKPLLPG